nr:transmembrane protease serine 9-like [Penaeus vannamei]
MASQTLLGVLTVAMMGAVSQAAPPHLNGSLPFVIEPRVNFDDTCRCGQKAAPRIVGGVTTGVNEWPWQAALMYGSQQFCGGSLINDRYVLTAAHCTESMRASDLTIRLAEHRLSTSSETSVVSRSVSQIIEHPDYQPGNEINDIALIKLSSPVQVSDTVLPVCMPPPNPTYAGKTATATGWGTTSSGGSSSDTLREVDVTVLSNTACQSNSYGSAIKDTMLCAGSTGKDSCQGDSGGPLVFKDGGGNYDQIGVVSWGYGCGARGYPGVYTRVNSYLDWIRTNTADGVYCKGMVFYLRMAIEMTAKTLGELRMNVVDTIRITTIKVMMMATTIKVLTVKRLVGVYKAALSERKPVATMASQTLLGVLTVAMMGAVSQAAPPHLNGSLPFVIEPRVNFDDTCRCGQKAAPRIVGGVTTGVNEWPWQAALMYGSQQFCGGSLINDRYVLTAAHCTESMRASDLTIRLAEHRLSTSSETSVVSRSVSQIIEHPDYQPGNEINDIALIKLSSPVQVSDTVLPVCMPPPNPTYAGKTATATGWGTTSSGGSSSDTLREVDVTVLSNTACQSNSYGSAIKDTMLCAGSTGKDSCQGDSGGPLVFKDGGGNYDQIGVVSWGYGCGARGYPGVYTRVNSYLDWIRTNTADGVYCKGMVF